MPEPAEQQKDHAHVRQGGVGLAETAFGGLRWLDQWRGEPTMNAVVVTGVVLALAWRRVAPVSVLLIVLGGFAGLAVAYGASQTSVAAFASGIAIYSAAAYGQSLALVAALTALGVVRDRFDPALVTLEDQVWSPLFAALAFAVGGGTRLHLRTTRVAENNVRALQREQEELVAAAVEDERRRIARELHDVVSHSLGVVVLQAGAAEQVLDDRNEVRKILQSIRTSGLEAIREMGTLLDLIRAEPNQSRHPLPTLADLPSLISHVAGTGVEATLHTAGTPRKLPAAIELSAYRIAQEGITNALTHAAPRHIAVTVRYTDHDLEVEVADDGAGGESSPGSRRGLAGIGERVAVFEGDFCAGPHERGGWSLRARLPVTR